MSTCNLKFISAEETQQYVKMFTGIERYPQLRNYFIGCHKVSINEYQQLVLVFVRVQG